MNDAQARGALEAILFVAGEAVQLQDLARALEMTVLECDGFIDRMAQQYLGAARRRDHPYRRQSAISYKPAICRAGTSGAQAVIRTNAVQIGAGNAFHRCIQAACYPQ